MEKKMKLVICVKHDKFCLLCENESEAALLGNKWYIEANIPIGDFKDATEVFTCKNIKSPDEDKWLKEVINSLQQQKSLEPDTGKVCFDTETDWFKKVIRKFKNDERRKK